MASGITLTISGKQAVFVMSDQLRRVVGKLWIAAMSNVD